MAFSTGFGLTCMCFIMLLFVPGQGQRQFTKTEPPNLREIPFDCCTETSKGLIKVPVKECYVQTADILPCRVHAYIFVTRSNERRCVDPDAWWLPYRLQRLEKNGIICKPFVHQRK